MHARLGNRLIALTGALGCIFLVPSEADASCVPGFDYAAFGKDSVTFQGGGTTDSFDSSIGPYASTVTATGGNVCTNGTAAGAVQVGGAGTAINGDVCVGAGGSTATSINTSGGATYGSGSVQTTNQTLTSVTIPSPFGANLGNLACGAACSPTPGNTYGSVTANGSIMTIGAGTYVFDSLKLVAGAQISVTGAAIIYIRTDLDLSGGAISNLSGKASDLVFMVGPLCPTVKLTGGAAAAFAVYAPDSDITVSGGGDVYGAIVGKTVKVTGGGDIHYDRALANWGGGGFACPPLEISRSTPIIATITGEGEAIVQGTYEYPFPTRTEVLVPADLTAFRFPYVQGHLHARRLSGVGSTAALFTNAALKVFDGKEGMPPVTAAGCAANYTVACRTVFTNSAVAYNPTNIVLDTSVTTANLLGPQMTVGLAGFTTADYQALIGRILAGNEVTPGVFEPKLGGMDRSTVAVIPPSLIAGSSRALMVYAGGTDGMLHAFCAENFTNPVTSVAYCQKGKELWAFAPRVLLDDLRRNLAIIDGSPRVQDMFGDFNGDGQKEFRTILTFITGTGERTANKTPAVYALDITDPQAPKVVWEYTWDAATSTRTHELGKGQVLAAGTVKFSGVKKNVVYAQTNNGRSLVDDAGVPGPGGEATVLVAIDVETGLELYAPVGYDYPDPVRVAANLDVPWQGVPGGAVGVDKTSSGYFSDLVFGTLFGDMWVVDPTTGASRYGTGPLFRLSADYKPIGAAPALFVDAGALYAVGVTGSYWDRSSATMWNSAPTQHGFAVWLGTPTDGSVTTPLTEASATSYVPFVVDFTGGQKLSSQAIVVGEQVFFTADTANVNAAAYGTGTSTGTAYGYSLTGALQSTDTLVVAGTGSLASSGTNLYASGGQGSEKLSYSATSTVGEAVNTNTPKLTRRLWLRTL